MGLDVQFFTVTGAEVHLTRSLARYVDLNDVTDLHWSYWRVIEQEARALLQTTPDGSELYYSHDMVQDLNELRTSVASQESWLVNDDFLDHMRARHLQSGVGSSLDLGPVIFQSSD